MELLGTFCGDVDVWRVRLDLTAEELAACREVLDDAERLRAQRIAVPAPRRRFVAARCAVRRILSGYTQGPPGSFSVGAAGKPALPGGPEFSVAHSGDLALCAVARRRAAVGIDLEQVRAVPEADRIARRFFAPEELRAWTAGSGPSRDLAFLRLWTRREAVLKALGVGLGVSDAAHGADPSPWSIVELSPAEGFVGALAVARDAAAGR